jgi:hypothetical protein
MPAADEHLSEKQKLTVSELVQRTYVVLNHRWDGDKSRPRNAHIICVTVMSIRKVCKADHREAGNEYMLL